MNSSDFISVGHLQQPETMQTAGNAEVPGKKWHIDYIQSAEIAIYWHKPSYCSRDIYQGDTYKHWTISVKYLGCVLINGSTSCFAHFQCLISAAWHHNILIGLIVQYNYIFSH